MAGRIPQSFINDLLDRTDIIDVIDARVSLKKGGRNYKACCPFHDEKTPSFSVDPDKQFYYCFGCAASGTALTFLMEFDRLEFVEAVETLAKLAGVEVPREADRGRARDEHKKLYAALAKAEQLFRAELKNSTAAVAYLKNRGLTGMVARDFAIGYAPDAWHSISEAFRNDPEIQQDDLLAAGLLTSNDKGNVYDRFRDRIVFPIRDTRGRVIGFGGRVMGDADGPKYLNSPETPVFHKGRELYGLYEVRNALRRIDQLIVVEGYMDVVALSQVGIANAVASLGTAATTDHFHKLFRYADEVVCCFDGDTAGRKAAWRALENALSTMTEGRQLKFMFLPDGEDPDSLVRQEGKQSFTRRVGEASPAIEYLFTQLGDGLDLQQIDGQAKLASLAMPFIAKVPEGVLKQLMRNRLERLTGLAEKEVRSVSRPTTRRVVGSALPAQGASAALTPLTSRLLAYALRKPWILPGLPEALRAQVFEHSGSDIFAEIVNYLDKNPDAELSQVVGRWAGEPIADELTRLAGQPLSLSDEAVASELEDGLAAYVSLKAREVRAKLLSEIKEAPSTEKLQALRSLQQGSDAPKTRGQSTEK